MAGDDRKKRRAEEQLSPYSQEPVDAAPAESADALPNDPPLRKARARRSRDSAVPRGNFKGLFGKVSLTDAGKEEPDTNDLIAGLNHSLMKALTRVVDKQANKNLMYLFQQYEKFVSEIKESSKTQNK